MLLRHRIVSIILLLAFTAVSAKLFYWQVIKGKALSVQAQNQHSLNVSIKAPRGSILSSDKNWLAARNEAWLLFADLDKLQGSINEIADRLAPITINGDDIEEIGKDELINEANRIKNLLTRDDVVWVPIKHKISITDREKIEALQITGLGFEQEDDRFYPEASAAAHLLGFVGKDESGENIGYFGLEGYYNLTLSGREGNLFGERDARGSPILIGKSSEYSAVGGVNLLTHIDRGVQLMLEQKLVEGIEKYGAKAGTAIIMDPKTGAVMGMSSYPSYEPARYPLYSNELFKNPAISDGFEPGSIFKVLVMAGALDSGDLEPDTKCDICTGSVKIDKYTIETWDREYRPDSSMVDVIVHSDNVGMVFVSQKLGIEKMYEYLRKFGIGEQTGIDLQGEFAPKLREVEKWSIVDLATASFGHGIAITPMQMIRAVSAIANKGKLTVPQVVDKLLIDGWEEDVEMGETTRVISDEASREITAMMVEAAKSGEAKWTHLRGFNIAGKTGTAQIPIAGHYDEEKTIASFVGFAPADDPKFAMIVTLKEPSSSPWSSETAAPLWYSIAKELFMYLGIQPVRN